MAGSLSNWAEDKIIAHSVGKESWAFPSSVFLALYTTAPSDDIEGTEVSIVSTGYYKKKLSSSFWGGSQGTLYNADETTFGPALSSWGSVEGLAVLDLSTIEDVSDGVYSAYNASTKVLTVTSPTLTAGALVGKHLSIGTTFWGTISANTTNTITIYANEGTASPSGTAFKVTSPKVVWYGVFSTPREISQDESLVFSPSSIVLSLT